MPYYQFTVPAGGATMTKVHSEVTGPPGACVHCSFIQVALGGVFVSGEPASGSRMVGIIRQGRSAEVKGKLIRGLADPWPEITDEPGAIY